MSARTVESLHPATWASIQLQGMAAELTYATGRMEWRCGCSQNNGKVWLCQYHDGMDDGAWIVEDKEDPDE